jgi:hypothetical protein
MAITLLLGFIGGVLGGNAIPHFARGITKQRYPNLWGGGPIPNVVAGWGGLVLAVLLLHMAFDGTSQMAAFIASAVGVLLIGLFHAGPGAFGRR